MLNDSIQKPAALCHMSSALHCVYEIKLKKAQKIFTFFLNDYKNSCLFILKFSANLKVHIIYIFTVCVKRQWSQVVVSFLWPIRRSHWTTALWTFEQQLWTVAEWEPLITTGIPVMGGLLLALTSPCFCRLIHKKLKVEIETQHTWSNDHTTDTFRLNLNNTISLCACYAMCRNGLCLEDLHTNYHII